LLREFVVHDEVIMDENVKQEEDHKHHEEQEYCWPCPYEYKKTSARVVRAIGVFILSSGSGIDATFICQVREEKINSIIGFHNP